ncbi:NAD(P)-dependent oxidoreductase [Kaistia granuli]|uniref:NAD(P)-dependent oxidoreductase n=1 Tax=Kaistia granuli TaxID=363259 RepID=UPI000369530D|nr:NAD(P)-dependent oxidoreductase [Kaistia granuli]
MVDIVISEFMHRNAVADLSRDFDVLYEPTLGMDPPALTKVMRQARALLIRDRTVVDIPLIARATDLRVVGQIGAVSDNIDMLSCEARGVSIVRAPDMMADAIGEYVIASAMMLMRGAFFSARDVMAGKWPRGHLVGREIGGRTLGLVGLDFGARAAATRARALGMRVVGWDPYLKPTHPVWNDIERMEFEPLLAEADIVSVHLPARPEFIGKLGTTALSRLKSGAVLISVGGGGIVDEAAVANMLAINRLRGAAFDGFETEPLTFEAGSIFAAVPNLLLTPRIADLTLESHLRSSAAIVAKVRGVLNP